MFGRRMTHRNIPLYVLDHPQGYVRLDFSLQKVPLGRGLKCSWKKQQQLNTISLQSLFAHLLLFLYFCIGRR